MLSSSCKNDLCGPEQVCHVAQSSARCKPNDCCILPLRQTCIPKKERGNKTPDDAFDVVEVADHVPVVERRGAHLDLGNGIVTVKVLADAVVVQKTVAVAEVNSFRDGIHGASSLELGIYSS